MKRSFRCSLYLRKKRFAFLFFSLGKPLSTGYGMKETTDFTPTLSAQLTRSSPWLIAKSEIKFRASDTRALFSVPRWCRDGLISLPPGRSFTSSMYHLFQSQLISTNKTYDFVNLFNHPFFGLQQLQENSILRFMGLYLSYLFSNYWAFALLNTSLWVCIFLVLFILMKASLQKKKKKYFKLLLAYLIWGMV